MSDLPPSSSTALPDELGARLRRKLAAVRWKLVRVDATGEVEWEDHANRDLHVVPGDGVLEVRP